ncbi:hypothetical protein I545_6819 [Mycobacterium kansasii 662]|uniref:Uncharacterized protein n=1 Tax=Mycobacterium kansasii 662 TaxID=1299326 RepID=X7XR91_MYCKA|nr:hypothetical protein I545_6819 [Mycobacterium kansasii 662]
MARASPRVAPITAKRMQRRVIEPGVLAGLGGRRLPHRQLGRILLRSRFPDGLPRPGRSAAGDPPVLSAGANAGSTGKHLSACRGHMDVLDARAAGTARSGSAGTVRGCWRLTDATATGWVSRPRCPRPQEYAAKLAVVQAAAAEAGENRGSITRRCIASRVTARRAARRGPCSTPKPSVAWARCARRSVAAKPVPCTLSGPHFDAFVNFVPDRHNRRAIEAAIAAVPDAVMTEGHCCGDLRGRWRPSWALRRRGDAPRGPRTRVRSGVPACGPLRVVGHPADRRLLNGRRGRPEPPGDQLSTGKQPRPAWLVLASTAAWSAQHGGHDSGEIAQAGHLRGPEFRAGPPSTTAICGSPNVAATIVVSMSRQARGTQSAPPSSGAARSIGSQGAESARVSGAPGCPRAGVRRPPSCATRCTSSLAAPWAPR